MSVTCVCPCQNSKSAHQVCAPLGHSLFILYPEAFKASFWSFYNITLPLYQMNGCRMINWSVFESSFYKSSVGLNLIAWRCFKQIFWSFYNISLPLYEMNGCGWCMCCVGRSCSCCTADLLAHRTVPNTLNSRVHGCSWQTPGLTCRAAPTTACSWETRSSGLPAVSYTHLTLPTIYSV